MNTGNQYNDELAQDQIGDEEMENREKPKVAYICGGNLTIQRIIMFQAAERITDSTRTQ